MMRITTTSSGGGGKRRWRISRQWRMICFSSFLISFLTVFSFLVRFSSTSQFNGIHPVNSTGEYPESFSGVQQQRRDTRPLMYNRVPKSGSEMLVLLMQWLQGYNGFKHVRIYDNKKRQLQPKEQLELLLELRRHQVLHGVPCSFDRHVYFINFKDFGEENPIYINLVRDPVDKAISRFFYHKIGFSKDFEALNLTISKEEWKKKVYEDCILEGSDPTCHFITGQSYDLTIPYFCGHDPRCRILNDGWALSTAMVNVEKYYTAVGVLEYLNETLTVLEHHVPFYFKGLRHMFYNELVAPKWNRNKERPRDIAEDIRQTLVSNLTMEYKFYNFLKERLLTEFKKISN